MDPYIYQDNSKTAKGMTNIVIAERDEVKLDTRFSITIKETGLKNFLNTLDNLIKENSITVGEDIVH